MFNPFNWIRTQAKAAFLGGIADGLQEIAPDGQPAPTLADLAARLTAAEAPPALPAADEQPVETPKARARKAA